MQNPLIALSNELASATQRASLLVAAIRARPRFPSSGLVWRNGVIVTADHTIRRDEEIRVTLPDGRTVAAELVGRDPGTDLAVLRADTGGAGTAEESAPDSVRAGALVLVLGRSEETGASAAMGVISSVSGPWHTWRGGKMDQLLRLDVALYPGASGGAVVDAGGKLIGIATAGLSRTSVLAIPLTTVNRVAEELLRSGHVARGFLGIGLQPIALPEHLRTKLNLPPRPKGGSGGLMVLSVEPDGPAGRAGIVLGDVLVAMDGKQVSDTEDVQEFLGGEQVGAVVKAALLRGGELTAVNVTIGERPRRRA